MDVAVRNGIAKASATLRNLDWFEVKEVRAHMIKGQVADWQVTIKFGFRLEESTNRFDCYVAAQGTGVFATIKRNEAQSRGF